MLYAAILLFENQTVVKYLKNSLEIVSQYQISCIFVLQNQKIMTQSKFRAYWYKAVNSTPAEKHVHFTRVMQGECYLIAKTDDPDFVSITGKLFCKNGGFEKVYDKHLHINRVKPFVEFIDASECANTCPNG